MMQHPTDVLGYRASQCSTEELEMTHACHARMHALLLQMWGVPSYYNLHYKLEVAGCMRYQADVVAPGNHMAEPLVAASAAL